VGCKKGSRSLSITRSGSGGLGGPAHDTGLVASGESRGGKKRENPLDTDRPLLLITYLRKVCVSSSIMGSLRARFVLAGIPADD